MPRPIELLAPARDLECGLEAIRHGADAVYIGAPRFGARAAAGNSISDIARLVDYAHLFGVRIYVTLNTLLRDDELPEAQALMAKLSAIHADALITQDPRLISLNSQLSAPLPLHSSTQMDNRTVSDVRSRLAEGYQQTVLARELSLDDIRAIHDAVPEMPLEVFVHGALCVSYSGRCYASEFCFCRSANRGECAQFCRLPFDLVDVDGHVIQKQRHLLSLRDMNRSADLEALLDAGVSSLKIEGRLKDVAYVKNITAFYRQQLDALFARRPDDYGRASYGKSTISFKPHPQKSFNRGFTSYFLHGRTSDLACHTTPKSIGEPVGTVKEVRPALSVAGTANFANGDGLCFFDSDRRLVGFRVNRVDQQGHLFPPDPSVLSSLRKGTPLYRNFDAAFEHQLSRPTADRRLSVRWLLEDNPSGFRLTLTCMDNGRSVSKSFEHPHELARTPQASAISRQLLRLGDTPFVCTEADITLHLSADFFIPASTLAEWRRELAKELETPCPPGITPVEVREAGAMLHSHNPEVSPPSREEQGVVPLMTCRYCIRHALGQCLQEHPTLHGPLALRLSDGRRFPLHFDCKRCEMQVLPPTGTRFTPEY